MQRILHQQMGLVDDQGQRDDSKICFAGLHDSNRVSHVVSQHQSVYELVIESQGL